MSNQKRDIAFYKRSKEPWTEKEYINIMNYVGDDQAFSWCTIDSDSYAYRKFIFDDGDPEHFMSLWSDQEENRNFSDCQQLAYEDVFENKEPASEIPEGTLVIARHKDGFTCKAKYFSKCNGKHIVDLSSTHAMIADTVEVIPTMTKKEAKQRVSELFADKSKVTSQMIRDIIDLIKE